RARTTQAARPLRTADLRARRSRLGPSRRLGTRRSTGCSHHDASPGTGRTGVCALRDARTSAGTLDRADGAELARGVDRTRLGPLECAPHGRAPRTAPGAVPNPGNQKSEAPFRRPTETARGRG